MAIVAKITEQYDLESGDSKRQITVRAVLYDDTDPNQTQIGQPIDVSVDRDGFLNTSKSDAARKAAIAKAVNDAVTESTANLEKVSTVAKSLVGMVIPITGASEAVTKG